MEEIKSYMYNYLYRIDNTINSKFYYGVRSCNCEPERDPYMGSGKVLHQALLKYGIENFRKTIIELKDSRREILDVEASVVTKSLVDDPMCYNIALGGMGGNNHGLIIVKDPDTGKFSVITKEELDSPDNRLVPMATGTSCVFDKNKMKFVRLSCEDIKKDPDSYIQVSTYYSGSGKYSENHPRLNKVLVTDDNNERKLISMNEYHENKSKYKTCGSGKTMVFDKIDLSYKMVPSEDYFKGKGVKYISSKSVRSMIRKLNEDEVLVIDKDLNIFPSKSPISDEVTDIMYQVTKSDRARKFKKGMSELRKKAEEAGLSEVIKVGNGQYYQYIRASEKDYYESLGYTEGNSKGCKDITYEDNPHVFITKDGVNKKIRRNKLPEFLSDGWTEGRSSCKFPEKRVTVNNGFRNKVIPESELQEHLSNGWIKGGRSYKKRKLIK